MTKRRALVTGGAGFIGSHVADALASAEYDVTALDDLSTGKRRNVAPGVRLEELDIRSPEAAHLVQTGGFDLICHLAAQIDVRKSVADPIADADRNILGTLNLLEAARQAPKPPRFIFSSTGGAIYGDFAEPPSAETEPKDPESPYGIAKLAAEYYVAYYGRVHKLDVVALRYANVYGPRQDPHGEAGVVAMFCQRLIDGTPVTVFGDGRQTRDYVFVGDVARANALAASAAIPRAGRLDVRAFNVGTGVPTSVLDLAEALMRAAGKTCPVEYAPARPGEQQRSFIDVSKSASVLGWTPSVALDTGLKHTYDWFRAIAGS
ncbi:UDP-glucose 4-epimerase [Gemmatimonadota bacterium]|nr:UDP-glucose 4-epimerase [Gemmatimonadota bacterium]